MAGRSLQRGITLVEFSATMAVAGIALTTAIGGFSEFIDRHRVETRTWELMTDIQLARSEAVARREAVRLSVMPSPSGACYAIHTGAVDACTCESGAIQCSPTAEVIKASTPPPTPDGIAVNSNVRSITFDPTRGFANQFGRIHVHSAKGLHAEVVIAITGRARQCARSTGLPGYVPCG